ncbi:hypothetical protein [Vannielia litorea]|uniref:hypothetical protein n=1 Tax=Vannielia litorea TaxID=1217970 RepID=UPI001BCBB8D7|nr:hypothetical protein [Vannielia litorea]MBS8225050.1 hypothetical protein [Vannielia litorea]
MAARARKSKPFNIVIVGHAGRLQYEAVLFAASLRHFDSGFSGRLFVAEPKPGELWSHDPRMDAPSVRRLLEGELGAEILPFESRHFGEAYPYGNKIEALRELPEGEPFIFFDTDTLVTGALSALPFDFNRPAASMKREDTWPEVPLYGPGYAGIWKSLYDKFGLEFESSLDTSHPDEYWQRYLYFNAGWFFGACGPSFGARFEEYALAIRDDAPDELACQALDPWLDQVALPLVIHSFGGGRPGPELDGLDGDVTCHWRVLSLLYARESDHAVAALAEVAAPNRIKKVLKEYEPFKRLIFQNKGEKARALFDRENLPQKEQTIRNRLKRENLWMR